MSIFGYLFFYIVYAKLFCWIVSKINKTLLYENSRSCVKEIGK